MRRRERRRSHRAPQGRGAARPASFGGLALSPLPPRFEDGFVDRSATSRAAATDPRAAPVHDYRPRHRGTTGPRFGTFTAVDRSASRSRRAKSSACSVRTVPANPPRSVCCAGCCARPAAPRGWPARTCCTRPPPPERASAIWRSGSRCMPNCPRWKTCASSPASTGWTARRARPPSTRLWTGSNCAIWRRTSPANCPWRQTAPCFGRRAVARPGNPVPRRTDLRRRSGHKAGVLVTHRGAGQFRRGRAGHQPFHGRSGILRPSRHCQRRPADRHRHPR